MTRFPTYPPDILSRADALLAEKYGTDKPVDPLLVEVACEAMMAVSEWRDTSTAPVDGTWFIGLAEDGAVYKFQWSRGEFIGGAYGRTVHRLAGWMPLPPPPIAKAIRGTK